MLKYQQKVQHKRSKLNSNNNQKSKDRMNKMIRMNRNKINKLSNKKTINKMNKSPNKNNKI